jgi:hypothetical protein
MLRAFNAFQMTAGFALGPFGISWLADQSFRGAGIAFYVSCLIYIVSFIFMTVAVSFSLDPEVRKHW